MARDTVAGETPAKRATSLIPTGVSSISLLFFNDLLSPLSLILALVDIFYEVFLTTAMKTISVLLLKTISS